VLSVEIPLFGPTLAPDTPWVYTEPETTVWLMRYSIGLIGIIPPPPWQGSKDVLFRMHVDERWAEVHPSVNDFRMHLAVGSNRLYRFHGIQPWLSR
jgi:hypothetical protein